MFGLGMTSDLSPLWGTNVRRDGTGRDGIQDISHQEPVERILEPSSVVHGSHEAKANKHHMGTISGAQTGKMSL